MHRFRFAALLLVASALFVQTQSGGTTVLRCGSLWDGKTDQVRRNVNISIANGKIASVGEAAPGTANTIDLSSSTCLPGLIDTHTHVLLQGDITAEDYDQQL